MLHSREIQFGDPRIILGEQYNAVPIDARLSALGLMSMQQPLENVADYRAPRESPMTYPGETPETSFALGQEKQILPIGVVDDPTTGDPRFFLATESGVIDIEDALEKSGLTSMLDRIPVITFGGNANPGQLEHKFSKLDDQDSYFIPTTKATVHDLVPVYVPKVGMWKYCFATMYPEKGTTTEVSVNWLTPAQLEHMHTTEKDYTFSQYGTAHLSGSAQEVPVYMYAGNDSVYVGENKKPVRVAECRVYGSELEPKTQTEIQETLFKLTRDNLVAQYPHITELNLGRDLHAIIDSMGQYGYKKVDVGKTMLETLGNIARISNTSLLSEIPDTSQNITPQTLRQILKYTAK